ncbi:MAG: mechanosensitive ion channel, partial [Burkholderiales bacterium]|nr:mechanosensitive ion channel [Burkholderiales bacterium]
AAAESASAQAERPGRVVVLNRLIVTLRSSFFARPPEQRAEEAERRIRQAIEAGGPLAVGVQERAEGTLVTIDGRSMFAVVPGDTADGTLADARAAAHDAAAMLQRVIDESREARDLRALLRATAVAIGVAALVLGVLWIVLRVRRRVEAWITAKTLANVDKLRVGGVEVVRREGLLRFERWLLGVAFWGLLLLLLYEWLSVTLALFPFTRPWGEQLNTFLFDLVARFTLGIVRAIPDLIAAGLIFWLAWLLVRLLRRFFAKVAAGQIQVGWLGADVAPTTSKLTVGGVWLFALVMAYPYLPGSDTEAFKGLSVLLGLMISLGASNIVGHLASGLILTYTRAFHSGEYVRIDSHEGTVTNLGAFTTRIRTGMGEELTIANTSVLGAVTRNYSRAVKGQGFIVDANVTIGYDVPWRQVEAMLVEAARRTSGVLADPRPRVFQVALSDFYPEYRLVCQAVPTEPRPRAVVMSELHANIQDVFNEYGVQIMSPNYRGDPAEPKVVPPARWYEAPAKPPEEAKRAG